MLHIYVLQKIYCLSAEEIATEVIDSRAFSAFCHIKSNNDVDDMAFWGESCNKGYGYEVPDSNTIGRFCSLLERTGVQKELSSQFCNLMAKRGKKLKRGRIIDPKIEKRKK